MINVISAITATGLAVGTMALIVVLSVFNGLESLIVDRFNSFDPDLKVVPVYGKTFIPDSAVLKTLTETQGVKLYSESIEENRLDSIDVDIILWTLLCRSGSINPESGGLRAC